MGFLSSIGKSISKAAGGIVGSVVGGLFNSNSAKSAQEDAQAYNTEVLQNRHQWEVNDLKAAGLNPILSATNSSGGAGVGASGFGTMPDIGANINSSQALRTQERIVDKQLSLEHSKLDLETLKANKQFELMKAQMENTNALTQKILSEKFGLDYENMYKPKLLEADYGIKVAHADMLRGQAAAGYASAADSYSRVQVNNAQVNQINASVQSIYAAIPKMKADGRLTNAEADKLEMYLKEVKKNPNLYSASIVGELADGSIGRVFDRISKLVPLAGR